MAATKACAYCYVALPDPTPPLCGRCRKRVFCSRECQKLDWKTGHKRFCGQSGEKDHDYCVRPSPGKGLGVFTMREFVKGEKVIVERPLIKGKTTRDLVKNHLDDIPNSARDAVAALAPDGAPLSKKMARNVISCSDPEDDEHITGLFVNMSRVNHSCVGNSDHQYLGQYGVKMLVANRDLAKGEEVTFSYAPSVEEMFPSRHAKLEVVWKFDCQCLACRDSEVNDKLERLDQLDHEIFRLASRGQVETALSKGHELISIYDELQMSPRLYQRTYYDMFQAAIVCPRSSGLGAGLARQAASYSTLFYWPEHEDVVKHKAFAANPSTHRNYHLLS